MQDQALKALLDAAKGPFPDGLACAEIDGVDVVMTDESVFGIASWYENGRRALAEVHRRELMEDLAEIDRIMDKLPVHERQYFSRTRAIASYLLEER